MYVADDVGLAKLVVMVCHADVTLPAFSSSALYPFATRVCGGASCSPGLSSSWSFFSGSGLFAAAWELLRDCERDTAGLHDDQADGASAWMGRVWWADR
jgi:hypothetical protein